MGILSTFRLFYLLGAVNALFFSTLIFSKKNKTTADKILGGWLIILFVQLFIPFLYLADITIYYQYAGYEIAFYVFHPVLLYLYVKATIGCLPGWWVIIWNILIIAISEIFCLSFMMYPAKERLLIIEGKEVLPLFYIPLIILMIGYFTYNIYASYKSLKDYKNKVLQVYSYRENVDLLWLRRLVVLFAGISVLVFPLGLVSYYVFHSIVFADYFFFVTLVIFVFFLGYWGYQQGQVFSFNNNADSQGDNNSIENIIPSDGNKTVLKHYKKEAIKLQEIMKNEKPYLAPTLTIHNLARLAGMPSHQISKVINKEFHCNFFEFINDYRIEEFKQRAFSSENKNLTILGIALDCGFNSKSAFNRIFKESTGITPGDFIKHHHP
jgi:AraC-like DNA-binding protein